ncbi:MAG: hypothetical protein AB4062_00545 [Crocosphaera sp.]
MNQNFSNQKLNLKRWSSNTVSKVLVMIAFLSIVLIINMVALEILKQPFNIWNHNRLTPAFALINHYKFFNAFENEPVLSWMYGPLAAISYLPATLANSPTVAIWLGAIISQLFFFIPIILLAIKIKSCSNLYQRILLFLSILGISFLLVNSSEPLEYSAFTIHADSPALGLAGISCIALYYGNSENNKISLILAALFSVLAIWTKQNLLPLPFALITYIWLVDGLKNVKIYLIYFLGFSISSIVIFGHYFRYDYLHFTMLKLPSSYHWVGKIIPGQYTEEPLITSLQLMTRLKVLTWAFYELIKFGLPIIILIALLYIHQVFTIEKIKKSYSEWIKENPWTLFLIVTIYVIPMTLMSRVKFGGALNSQSITLYFFLCAFVAFLASRINAILQSYHNSKLGKYLFLSVIIILIGCLISTDFTLFNRIKSYSKRYQKNPVEQAYQYNLKYPGKAYFPQFPLIHLMSEGKLYHSFNGLWDREKADLGINKELFEKHTPSNIDYVAFYRSIIDNEVVMKHLPEYNQETKIDELKGWILFQK